MLASPMEPNLLAQKCDELLQLCKHKAKQLLEANVNSRKVHWTHPSFVSFCLVVEEVLSYGTHKQYQTSSHKLHNTASAKVLQGLTKTYPVAFSIHQMCYGGEKKSESRPDYAKVHTDSSADKKIVWVRTALVEHTLKAIVDEILKNPSIYYKSWSVMCHSVYAELFSFLLDGPCSLKFTRMKSIDSSLLAPGPTELVSRHNRVVHDTSPCVSSPFPSGEKWEHVQSLYQNPLASCLYGKNNVMMKPASISEPLTGYLTLQKTEGTLSLKWLPNSLLDNGAVDHEYDSCVLWGTVLSVDVCNSVAHLHCHHHPVEEGKREGEGAGEATLILIGYDGITLPSLHFPEPASLVHFLEALENGLQPRGCLEPPLWFLKQQQMEKLSIALSSALRTFAGSPMEDHELPPIWNHVFRVRFSRRPVTVQEESEADSLLLADDEVSQDSSTSSPVSESSSQPPASPASAVDSTSAAINMPGNSKRLLRHNSRTSDLEMIQRNVSQQLLGRYFYSWRSYCRHIAKVKSSVAHLVKTEVSFKPKEIPVTNDVGPELESSGLGDELWEEFLEKRDMSTWRRVEQTIYRGGIRHHLRAQVWPYLLGLFPVESTTNELSQLTHQRNNSYKQVVKEWKTLERDHYRNNDPTSTPLVVRHGLWGEDAVSSGSLSAADSNILPSEPSANKLKSQSRDLIDLEITSSSSLSQDDEKIAREVDVDDSNSVSIRVSPPSALPLKAVTDLSEKERLFIAELFKIDKDIPRCDRDYEYFLEMKNLTKLRNVISSYVWLNVKAGYSQGMCDLLAPLLVVFDNEMMAFNCFQLIMTRMDPLFPPKGGMSERLANLHALLQVLESDFFQYLSDIGDALFYCYRWFLVNFKREFVYSDIFLLWEVSWAARNCCSDYFEEFLALALLLQYKMAIMDAQLDPSEILNLFTDLADKKQLDCRKTITVAHSTIQNLQSALGTEAVDGGATKPLILTS